MTREEKIERLINIISQLNDENVIRLSEFVEAEAALHNQGSCQERLPA